MRSLPAAIALLVGLLGCTAPPADPVGTYQLDRQGDVFVLELLPHGVYTLTAVQRVGTHIIKGRWEKETGSGPSVSIHGVIWRGAEPEGGNGIWAATIESNSRICLDAEELTCFEKKR